LSVFVLVVVQLAPVTVSLDPLTPPPLSNRPPKARKVHVGVASHVIPFPNASPADAVTPPNPAGTVAYFTVGSKDGSGFTEAVVAL